MYDMFRLEHRDCPAARYPFNRGVYQVYDVRYYLPQSEVHSPAPFEDGLHGHYGGPWYFGFRHLPALDVWFSYELRQLLRVKCPEEPLVVRHYRGPEVAYGDRQMVMCATTAKRVATLDLVTLQVRYRHAA